MTELHPEADALFQVIATGHPLPDQSADAVRGRLEHTLKLPAATAARLLAGKPVLLKRALTRVLADDYCARLRAAGLAVEIVPTPAAMPAVTPTPHVAPVTATPKSPPSPDFLIGPAIDGLIPVSLRLLLWPQTLQLLATPLLYGLLLILVVAVLTGFAIAISAWLHTAPLFFALPVFLLPLLAGLMLLAMLLRPLLPLRTHRNAPVIANGREPNLEALVAQLCQHLGAATPAAIHIDLSHGARVVLNSGRDGWQRGRYTLHIGLPLIQNAAQPVLTGALAAELIFAREPALLRLREIVTRVRSWLDRQSAALPDHLSQRLAQLPESRPADLLQRADRRVVARLAAGFAKLSQRSSHHAERTLLQIGDRASVAIAGADAVTQRLSAHYQLDRATERALEKNTERRIDRRLVDDLVPLIGFFYTQQDDAHEKKIARATEAGAAAQIAGFSDRERIGLAAKIADEFAPQTLRNHDILQHADALGREATAAWYVAANVSAGERMPAERLVDDALLDLEQSEAGALYFNNWLISARGWRLPDVELLRDLQHADSRLQLNVCVNEVRRLTPDRARLLTEFARLQTQLNELLLGQQVLAANHPFQFRYLKYDGTSLTPLIEQRQREIAKIIDQLGTQESIMGGRIALGLKLFGQDGAASEALHHTLHFLGEQEKALYRLEQDATLLENLLQHQRQTKQTGYADALARLTEKVGDASVRLLDKLKHAPSPPDRRYTPLRDFFDDHLSANNSSTNSSSQPRQRALATAARARSVLDGFYVLNEKLSLLAAEQASSVEEAYKIERIRLVNAE